MRALVPVSAVSLTAPASAPRRMRSTPNAVPPRMQRPDHVQITRFKHLQLQRTAGQQHGVQRKQRQLGRHRIRSRSRWRHGLQRSRNAVNSFSCRPPNPPLLMTSTLSPASAWALTASAMASMLGTAWPRAAQFLDQRRGIPAQVGWRENIDLIGRGQRRGDADRCARPCAWCWSAAPAPPECAPCRRGGAGHPRWWRWPSDGARNHRRPACRALPRAAACAAQYL